MCDSADGGSKGYRKKPSRKEAWSARQATLSGANKLPSTSIFFRRRRRQTNGPHGVGSCELDPLRQAFTQPPVFSKLRLNRFAPLGPLTCPPLRAAGKQGEQRVNTGTASVWSLLIPLSNSRFTTVFFRPAVRMQKQRTPSSPPLHLPPPPLLPSPPLLEEGLLQLPPCGHRYCAVQLYTCRHARSTTELGCDQTLHLL